jgi:hypothetical protein
MLWHNKDFFEPPFQQARLQGVSNFLQSKPMKNKKGLASYFIPSERRRRAFSSAAQRGPDL